MVGDDFGTERLLSLVNRVFKEEDFDEVMFLWKGFIHICDMTLFVLQSVLL